MCITNPSQGALRSTVMGRSRTKTWRSSRDFILDNYVGRTKEAVLLPVGPTTSYKIFKQGNDMKRF